ncbi:hypothetical protein JYK14_06355 [Siccirubricoccus sp. KC 17139]|uniref:Uncharacterized protein n=1 Tax=Siccirubricoccus soli TaxID=2899147 RepID=A0ABT1D3L9_9PROT|nr:hypothetical protein [Siccirubricoccus soli]MCO6415799.1 hypothetical protein [Siccirubricoccus soli]MCP2681931.1 hypothetical protein [Siccirubricoccus soli]
MEDDEKFLDDGDPGTLPWRKDRKRGLICDFEQFMSCSSNDVEGTVRHIVCTVKPDGEVWTWRVVENGAGVFVVDNDEFEEVELFRREGEAASREHACHAAERVAGMLCGYGGAHNAEVDLYYRLSKVISHAVASMPASQVRAILEQFLPAYAAGAELPKMPETPTGTRLIWFR